MTNFLSGEQAGTAPHKEFVGQGGGDHVNYQDVQVFDEEHVQVFKWFKKRFKDCAISDTNIYCEDFEKEVSERLFDELVKTKDVNAEKNVDSNQVRVLR